MRPLNIYVDVDGVLANFCELYLDLLEGRTGRKHAHADITSFDFTKCIASEQEDNEIWRHIDACPGLVRKLKPVAGAMDALAKLRMLGHVRALTSPHLGPTWMYERALWLTSRGFTKRDIIFCAHKSLVPGDVFIEDNLDHVEAWAEAHPNGTAILFDAPYNQGKTSVPRARGWYEVLMLVERRVPQLMAGASPAGDVP